MTREETLAWAKSLKPGDTVIWNTGWPPGEISILVVEKVTPTGRVKTTNGMTFAQTSWTDSMSAVGTRAYGYIISVTDDLLLEEQKQDADRKEMNRQKQVILEARSKIWEECNKRFDLTYKRAAKILEFFNQIDAEEEQNC